MQEYIDQIREAKEKEGKSGVAAFLLNAIQDDVFMGKIVRPGYIGLFAAGLRAILSQDDEDNNVKLVEAALCADFAERSLIQFYWNNDLTLIGCQQVPIAEIVIDQANDPQGMVINTIKRIFMQAQMLIERRGGEKVEPEGG